MRSLTPDKIKQQAHNIGVHLVEQQQTDDAELKATIDEIANTSTFNEDDIQTIAALIALPDDQFAILSPIFLGELERSYNDINNQLLMVQMMNVAGRRAEDAEEEYDSLCDTIEQQLAGQLSRQKRDFLKAIIGLMYNAIAQADGIAKRKIIIPIEYCREGAKEPAYAHLSDAGLDVYATEDITIAPGETKLVPLGFKVAIPLGYELQVRPRSGLSLRTKLRVANAPGTIDAGYRDEVGVIIENIDPPIRAINLDFSSSPNNPIPAGAVKFGQSYTIGAGEKFAQLVLSEVPKVIWSEVESVADIGEDRGGGYGSTGAK